MRKILDIAKKELSSYFRTPIAYIVLIVAAIVFNMFFFIIVDNSQEASLRDVFKVMEFLFVFIVPILTMKVFAEEKATGTMEFLMTTPTTNNQIVLGKYLGSLAFFGLMVAPTGVYYLILEIFSSPDRATILTGYLGILIEGAFFISVGIMCSSWSKNQIVSAILSYSILFMLYFSLSFIKYFSGIAEQIIRYTNIMSHSENFLVGLITVSDLIYFISGILFCLVITRVSIDKRI
ncbi:MAG: ABC transporter permease [Candidatus Zapsychrus exili]|nr:ABC transporter permease [Candidatus Zapsychrus exili]